MDQRNFISTLISQHLSLRASLKIADEDARLSDQSKNEEIFSSLVKFKNDLLEHLKLENEILYPDLLKKMRARNQDTTNTEKFIAEMDDIGKVIMGFLEKYNSSELIASQLADFQPQLRDIITTLNLRIESEEEGVFQIYLAMTD